MRNKKIMLQKCELDNLAWNFKLFKIFNRFLLVSIRSRFSHLVDAYRSGNQILFDLHHNTAMSSLFGDIHPNWLGYDRVTPSCPAPRRCAPRRCAPRPAPRTRCPGPHLHLNWFAYFQFLLPGNRAWPTRRRKMQYPSRYRTGACLRTKLV